MPEQNPAPLTPPSTLADLPNYDFHVSLSTPGQAVADAMQQRAELPGVILCNGQGVQGLISRQTFFKQMSRLFSLEVYMKRPIQVMWDAVAAEPLVLPASTPVGEAGRRALARTVEWAYEPILIVFPDQTARLLDVLDLLKAQNQLLEVANAVIQRQKEEAVAANQAKS